jgi:hypothetical protein
VLKLYSLLIHQLIFRIRIHEEEFIGDVGLTGGGHARGYTVGILVSGAVRRLDG